jgi:hypothetical protein
VVVAAERKAVSGIARAAIAIRYEMGGLHELRGRYVAERALAAIAVKHLELESLLIPSSADEPHHIVALLERTRATGLSLR